MGANLNAGDGDEGKEEQRGRAGQRGGRGFPALFQPAGEVGREGPEEGRGDHDVPGGEAKGGLARQRSLSAKVTRKNKRRKKKMQNGEIVSVCK